MSEVQDRLIGLVEKQLGRKIENVDPNVTLEEMGVDSFDFIELVFLIEDEFGIEIQSNAQALGEKLKTLGDVIAHVDALRTQPAAS